ncbi:DNA processing protein [Acidovorax delafieldii]|uniref:DNA processing protein n=1 Tax=Acidovorax delafieldii TaxID=47920 RepID=A0AAJ2EYQ5_ACIDE|nr:DNA-processing protein DprA [Acidovorax delafieldii]MDR6764881.1 DNA processing protein [Acidovorax delafieldii]MDR6835318.1 DNA processing protein [Acidovorax delafieldii]MDR7365712.1 DNA processing protein [Acidovorax delafieldii]
MDHDELGAWLRLTLTPGIGNGAARRLLARFGLPQSIFQQTEAALQLCVPAAQAKALREIPQGWEALWQTTAQWLASAAPQGPARAIVSLGDLRYPQALLDTEDPPLLLYLMGPALLLEHQPFPSDRCLAVVGSRNPTAQGAENARLFARALCGAGLTIVSGLALGVDAAAHEGALEAATSAGTMAATIAVVGTGLDRVYPRKNLDLAHRIAAHGLIVSEYPLGTPPLPGNFPKRNRIISGLSQGTLVVEAALASGSLITARMAAEQGREVFAIPGSIHAPQSRGCHALIRQGAKLVESAQDVLEELKIPATTVPGLPHEGVNAPGAAASDETEDPVLAALGYDPMGLDALIARTGMDASTLQVALLELELDGRIARLPGGLFQRVGRG